MGSQTRNHYVHAFTFVLARQYIKLWIINFSTSPHLLFNKIFQKRYIEKKKKISIARLKMMQNQASNYVWNYVRARGPMLGKGAMVPLAPKTLPTKLSYPKDTLLPIFFFLIEKTFYNIKYFLKKVLCCILCR